MERAKTANNWRSNEKVSEGIISIGVISSHERDRVDERK
jgi:hypothetical protein